MHSCVRAGAFFLRRLLQKVDCENLNFGGAVRGQTQLPQRDGDGGTCEVAWGICGAGSSSGNFCLRQGAGQEGRFWKTSLARPCWCYFLCLCLVVCGFFLCFFLCFFLWVCLAVCAFFLCFLRCFFLCLCLVVCAFFFVLFAVLFFCGYDCAFLFVLFSIGFFVFFPGNHVWLFVLFFCAFCGAFFCACVW